MTLLERSSTGAWVAVVSWMTRGLIRHVMVELKCNLPSPGATVQPNGWAVSLRIWEHVGLLFVFLIVWRGYDKLKQITLTASEVIFDSRAAAARAHGNVSGWPRAARRVIYQ